MHLRTLAVTPGTWISSGTILGKIQNAPSSFQGDSCWTGIHVHMEESSGTWQSAPVGQWQSYTTWVVAYTGTGITRAMRSPQQLVDTQKRGPVVK